MKIGRHQHSRAEYTNDLRKGFSLLEIIFVLGLVAVLTTWITVSVTTVETEQQLREASGVIVSMTTRARNISVRQQRPYTVTVTENKTVLTPKYFDANEDQHERGFDEEDSKPAKHENILADQESDLSVTYEISRWGSDDWVLLEKDKKVSFTIEPSGLVEPIAIRCSIGKSWLIQRLHPLTGGVRDEEMSIEKE